MKTICFLFACFPLLAFAQSGTGERRFADPNASINKTDRPRTLNANNSTNSTPGDWVSEKDPAKATAPTQTGEPKTGSTKQPGTVIPTEGKATESRVSPKDKKVKSQDIPGSKKKATDANKPQTRQR